MIEAGIGLLLIFALWSIGRGPPRASEGRPASRDLAITFKGYTNWEEGWRAVIEVSNRCRQPVWLEGHIILRPATEGAGESWYNFALYGKDLGPGKTFEIVLPAPTNRVPWRTDVGSVRHSEISRKSFIRRRVHSLPLFLQKCFAEYIALRPCYSRGDWIQPLTADEPIPATTRGPQLPRL